MLAQDRPRGFSGVLKQPPLGRLAELIKDCIVDKKPVKAEVNRFRAKYRKLKYSYDGAKEKKTKPAKSGK